MNFILNRRIGRGGFAVLSAVSCILIAPLLTAETIEQPTKLEWALALTFIGVNVLLTTWRCHDFNESFWSNFAAEQVPLVGGFIAAWDLLRKPSDVGFNRYGPPPAF